MKYVKFSRTDLTVSQVCLGTMTFGEQNSESEAHQQLDYAVSKGVNFIDTAEMYPIAAREATLGSTERFIGSWLKKRGRRDDLVIATKIAGPNRGMDYIRQPLDFSAKNMVEAVEKSLSQLQTDYIDLYQLHWPERKMNMFGVRGLMDIDHEWVDYTEEVLSTAQNLIKEGKIRYIGVSNEAPWGVMNFLNKSEKLQLPRIATIQNPYSLLNRTFEVGLTEICMREEVSLMAYSPLAFGILSGKHLNGAVPNSRIGLFSNFTRYTGQMATEATAKYSELAKRFGMSLAQMSIAFVKQQKFVSSTIIGATTIEQLEENIGAFDIVLTEEQLEAIHDVHERYVYPAP